jgi:5-oxoprolinase (ATP-hydrolysing)
VWIDTGGTFTDCVALDPEGVIHRAKVLSTSALRGAVVEALAPRRLRIAMRWRLPDGFLAGFRFRLLQGGAGEQGGAAGAAAAGGERRGGAQEGGPDPGVEVAAHDARAGTLALEGPLRALPRPGAAFEVSSREEAPVLAARLVTQTPAGADLPPIAMRLATTRGTNTLLERRGARVALFITRGFADILAIGTQARPDLFALRIEKPPPLHEAVIEVPERVAADGRVIEPLAAAALARLEPEAARLLAQGVKVAAVAFLNSYANPRHEDELARWLERLGFERVSRSSRLAPRIKALARAETAVVDAYLAPAIGAYLERVRSALAAHDLHVMTSAGGLVRAGSFTPKDSLLSGPAGGVGGAAWAGRRSGLEKVIAFDMGGTSTDVARFDGDFEYVFEHQVGDARLVAPALAIESVAAGGGSICSFDGTRLRVGPESAGAFPGPASYGAGGPLTLTDANLLLGRIAPERFEVPLDLGRAEERLAELRAAIAAGTGEAADRDALLEGLIAIADERMADAIRKVSLRRGYDPSGYALVAFGGAGAQHACGVAARLGARTVVVPCDAGLLSALGLGHAVIERFAERQVLAELAAVEGDIARWCRELAEEARAAVEAEGVPAEEIVVRRRLAHLRFAGQDSVVEIEHDPGAPLAGAFRRRHEELYGHVLEGRAVELESLRVVASSRRWDPGEPGPAPAPRAASPEARARARIDGAWREVPVHERSRLAPGERLEGPALVVEAHTTTLVGGGWRGEVDGAGNLLLSTLAPRPAGGAAEPDAGAAPRAASWAASRSEAVRAELFTNRFRAVVEEMGEALRRTALSTNVKERLDFSCALLDQDARLVVNAPHIPVHLGALGLCVRRLREAVQLGPGEVVVTNHPAFGGSHLPDVTVVTPVHAAGGELLGYVASRAHHAEIGGTRPGSMPPAARRLLEEGVVIPPTHIARRGRTDLGPVRRLLKGAPFPSRAVEENIADLAAALAANHRGAAGLRALAAAHGAATIRRYMEALEDRAARALERALERLPRGRREALETLDDGTALKAAVEIAGGRAVIDFAGTAGVHPGNLNATPAIVQSVVIYVLRLLVNEPLPLNEGLLVPVTLRIPPGLLDPPFPDDPALAPAVVGGNVETSQRLADVLIKAFGLAASSQGTMNNVVFGTERFGYYETICGGAGAGPGFAGASAVHTHMTNTRITDVEVLERRYPVRVRRFAVRRGSGGRGRFQGGDGVVREIELLAPVSLSILSQRRASGPSGLAGGADGAPGAQRVVRRSGEVLELRGIDTCELAAGDRFIIETPGGGGYGAP